MSIDENAFHKRADETLHTLMDVLDQGIGGSADIDLQGGMLSIALEDGRQFVVNKHAPTRQLWLSSPVSGAWHFAWNDDRGHWCSTRDPAVNLKGLLSSAISTASGHALSL